MANIKWIGTQEIGKDMEPLLTKYETVFIECEFHGSYARYSCT